MHSLAELHFTQFPLKFFIHRVLIDLKHVLLPWRFGQVPYHTFKKDDVTIEETHWCSKSWFATRLHLH